MAKKKTEQKTEQSKKNKAENKMHEFKIEKLVLSIAGTGEKLERGVKLLKVITGMTPLVIKSRRRIPSLGVRPGLEVGCKVTVRENIPELLKKLLTAIEFELKESQFVSNHFSFGIKEYIEIGGMEYQREIGIMGLNVTVDFTRAGSRVKLKKIKTGRIPRRQDVKGEEIIEYMKKNFNIKLKEKGER